MRGRVRERADEPEQFKDRAWPAVRDEQGQRVLVTRFHVDEVNDHTVDLGLELRERVELRLGLTPVVFGCPVSAKRLNRRQLHALRAVLDELLRWPAGCLESAPKVVQIGLGSLELERANGDINGGGCTHFCSSSLLAKRPECGAHLVGKQRWLLPGGEVSAYREPVVMD